MRPHPFAAAEERLRELEANEMRRSLRTVQSGPGPVIEAEGRRLINFSSNNFLGLAEHPALAAAAAEAATRWGTGATASRLIVGSNALVDELESRLGAWRRAESALVFPTGYQTNLGVVGTLAGKGDLIVADKLCHASLIDAARLSGATLRTYPHGDLDVLEKRLEERAVPRAARACAPLVLTDGVFSMDGDLCDLPALIEITERHGALLLVDDAHAVGVFGATGAGTLEHFGLEPPPHLIRTATLSKALGAQGGFVCGPRPLIDLVVNSARSFIYTTGLAPPAAAAALAALDVIAAEPDRRARLWRNRDTVADALTERGWNLCDSASPILPLMAGEAERAVALSNRLLSSDVLGVPIRPPTVAPGKSRVRLTVMATHEPGHLSQLIDAAGTPDAQQAKL